MTKAELARRLGVDESTVHRWGNDQPQYAIAYLELLEKYESLLSDMRDIVEGYGG